MRRCSLGTRWSWPFLLVLLYGAVAFGEDLQIRGEVTDSEGAVVRGATIRLLGEQTRLTLYRCKADEYGRFEFDGVMAGRYMIAASAPGFRERLLPLGSPQAERLLENGPAGSGRGASARTPVHVRGGRAKRRTAQPCELERGVGAKRVVRLVEVSVTMH